MQLLWSFSYLFQFDLIVIHIFDVEELLHSNWTDIYFLLFHIGICRTEATPAVFLIYIYLLFVLSGCIQLRFLDLKLQPEDLEFLVQKPDLFCCDAGALLEFVHLHADILLQLLSPGLLLPLHRLQPEGHLAVLNHFLFYYYKLPSIIEIPSQEGRRNTQISFNKLQQIRYFDHSPSWYIF